MFLRNIRSILGTYRERNMLFDPTPFMNPDLVGVGVSAGCGAEVSKLGLRSSGNLARQALILKAQKKAKKARLERKKQQRYVRIYSGYQGYSSFLCRALSFSLDLSWGAMHVGM